MTATDRLVQRLVLGIETATPAGGAALASAEGELIGHHWSRSRTGFSRRLMPTIQELLGEAKADKSSIAAVGVTHGPGSFTGVRVGMTTAKTLAQALGVPLYTFSTLECVALRGRGREATGAATGAEADAEGTTSNKLPICVALDARRKEVYTAIYRVVDDGKVETVRDDRVEAPAALLDYLATELAGPLEFAGDWPLAAREMIEDRLGENVTFRSEKWASPAADSVALAAAACLAGGREGIAPFEAVPRYIRASDAVRHAKGPRAETKT